jgi:hypothetical protein
LLKPTHYRLGEGGVITPASRARTSRRRARTTLFDHRYEPPRDPFITKRAIFGAPDLDRATTAHIERQNGTMRHFIGRMRRLVYAFSKKLENHRAAISLCYAYYNYCWVVKTLRVTPAMALGVTDHIWELEEFMVAALSAPPCETSERKPLEHRKPETTARELPNGRGFLRVVQGGKDAPSSPPPEAPTPPPTAPAVPSVEAPALPSTAPVDDRQLSLLAWRPKPPPKGQLSLFREPPEGWR